MKTIHKNHLLDLESQLQPSEQPLFSSLDTPAHIQAFLNRMPYSEDQFYRCPLRVLRDRKAHCFDGALFAAMALRRLGYPPLILELIPNERDDDHLLALFKQNNHWGAVAQSNFTGLRYRDPIYQNIRELVMSYFDNFFNTEAEKTLRGYRGPVNLSVFDRLQWMTSDQGLDTLAEGLDHYKITSIITTEMTECLTPVDERSLRAGLMGAKTGGLFKVS